MATPSAIPAEAPANACIQRMHRMTRENRSLWYQLTVLQQPARARACGSGMKANSDRRPVDPPPVIELRIIDGPSVEEGKDITFDYNANFFLYASLEKAREIAPGRLPNAVANNPPILTGVPASGMAYLDRPSEAGYFIFPDLSVRHEGRFVLNFSLFETTKEEKDFDQEPADANLPPGVDWRMEIKTDPFHVYSAKKFPGLMESTQLSKTVADQGCRVRIRRDVRMRKRDNKGGAFDRREEFARRKTVTPGPEDPNSLRARSLSNSSEHRVPYTGPVVQPPKAIEPQRRPSLADSYPPPPPPPPGYDANQAGVAPRGHLSFGDSAGPQYPPPRQYSHHQGPQLPPMATYPPSQSAYVSPESQPYGYHSRNPSSSCPSPALSVKQDPYEQRHPHSYMPPSPSVFSSDAHSRRELQHSAYPPMSHVHPPAPPKPSPVPSTRSDYLQIVSLSANHSPLPPIEAQTEPLPPVPAVATGGKRKHDFVFNQNTKPLHNGKRQQDPHYGGGRRGLTPEPDRGQYSRADGQIGYVTFNTYHH